MYNVGYNVYVSAVYTPYQKLETRLLKNIFKKNIVTSGCPDLQYGI